MVLPRSQGINIPTTLNLIYKNLSIFSKNIEENDNKTGEIFAIEHKQARESRRIGLISSHRLAGAWNLNLSLSFNPPNMVSRKEHKLYIFSYQ